MTLSKTEKTAALIREDLRHALRLWDELHKPIDVFMADETRQIGQPRFYVVFDLKPRKKIAGLQIQTKNFEFYDEPIINKTLEFASKVWHLKDKLSKYARYSNCPLDIDGHVNQHQALKIVSDLTNANKHGGNGNRSGISPVIDLVRFNTSKSGVIELYLDGATKEKELLVTFKTPIAYTVDLKSSSGASQIDAVQVIYEALICWLPCLRKLGVLDGDNREAKHLRETLKL